MTAAARLPYSDVPATQREERYEAEGERASLRVYFYTQQVRDSGGFIRNQVVGIEMAQRTKHTKGWKPPKARPMIHHRIEDWHGGGTVSLPEDMSPEEVEYRLRLARSIHGPDSQEKCCVAKRAKLAHDEAMQGAP